MPKRPTLGNLVIQTLSRNGPQSLLQIKAVLCPWLASSKTQPKYYNAHACGVVYKLEEFGFIRRTGKFRHHPVVQLLKNGRERTFTRKSPVFELT